MIFLLELNVFLWSLFISGESSANEMTQGGLQIDGELQVSEVLWSERDCESWKAE